MSQIQEQTQTQSQSIIPHNIVMDAKKILRYKYSPDMVEQLERFGRLHQHDSACEFKDAWVAWSEINRDLVTAETERLVELGCENANMEEKMFRSARYYFRKKGTEKKEPVQRKKYVGIPRTALADMDTHIAACIAHAWYTPASGFEHFKTEHVDVVAACKLHLENADMDSSAIDAKIKKTYKNRYFVVCTKGKANATTDPETMVEPGHTENAPEDLLALALNS